MLHKQVRILYSILRFDELNHWIQIYLLSSVGYIEIELVSNTDTQSVKARSLSMRQRLYQNKFEGLMANYLVFKKNYSKNKTLHCLKNEFIAQADGKIDEKCILQEKLIKSCERI